MTTKIGYLTCYTGPMFSGKTSQLFRELIKMKDINPELNILMINHSLDTRNNNQISCHQTNLKIPSSIDYLSTNSLSEISVQKYQIIGIDECQFFSDLYEQVMKWLREGLIVYCSGLTLDFKAQKFGQLLDLIPHADVVHKLRAKCKLCLQELKGQNLHIPYHNTPDAIYTKRLSETEEQILIGAKTEYVPVCRYHMFNIYQ